MLTHSSAFRRALVPPSRSAGREGTFTPYCNAMEKIMPREIIPVTTATIEGAEKLTCNARDLHAFLGAGRDFSNWIKGRIAKYEFVEDVDFIRFANSGESTSGGDNRTIDYTLSLDMAKELAMVENNKRGREIRRYFIACERRAREIRANEKMTIYDYAEELLASRKRLEVAEKCIDMIKPRTPIGTISKITGRPRNRIVPAYPRSDRTTIKIPAEYRHLFNYLQMTNQTFLLESDNDDV